MFCNKCGNTIPDGYSFCNKCGAPVKPVTMGSVPAAAPVMPSAPVSPVTNMPKGPANKVLRIGCIILAVLFALQLALWFIPQFHIEAEIGSRDLSLDARMGMEYPQNQEWVIAFWVLFIPLTAASIVLSLLAVFKTKKPKLIVQMIAAVGNIASFAAFWYAFDKSMAENVLSRINDTLPEDMFEIEMEVLSAGWIFAVLAAVTLIFTFVAPLITVKLGGTVSSPKPFVPEHTSDSVPTYIPVAPVKTVKCSLCGFDVPEGNKFCIKCGTSLNAVFIDPKENIATNPASNPATSPATNPVIPPVTTPVTGSEPDSVDHIPTVNAGTAVPEVGKAPVTKPTDSHWHVSSDLD